MKALITILCLFGFQHAAWAQIETPVKWSYASKLISKREAVLLVKAELQKGWHIYSTQQAEGGPLKTSFTFTSLTNCGLSGNMAEPPPMKKYEKVYDMNIYYFENSVVFRQKIKLQSQPAKVKGSVNFMVCNDKKCLNPETVDFSIVIDK